MPVTEPSKHGRRSTLEGPLSGSALRPERVCPLRVLPFLAYLCNTKLGRYFSHEMEPGWEGMGMVGGTHGTREDVDVRGPA